MNIRNFVILKDGVVVGINVYDLDDPGGPPSGAVDVTDIPCAIGWIDNGDDTFIPSTLIAVTALEQLELDVNDDPTGRVFKYILTVEEVRGLFTRTEAVAILGSVNTTVVDYLGLLGFFGGTIDVTDASNDYATFITVLRTEGILATDARRDDLLQGKLIV